MMQHKVKTTSAFHFILFPPSFQASNFQHAPIYSGPFPKSRQVGVQWAKEGWFAFVWTDDQIYISEEV